MEYFRLQSKESSFHRKRREERSQSSTGIQYVPDGQYREAGVSEIGIGTKVVGSVFSKEGNMHIRIVYTYAREKLGWEN